MKICSIYNEYDNTKSPVAYLIYYENSRRFYIEICDDAEFDNLPMMLALYIKDGIYSIDSYWSKNWVDSRIVPTDRQNLGQILKAGNMECYDEYKLLIKSKGMCSHDDFCVEEISLNKVNQSVVTKLYQKKIRDILVDKNEIIVFFNDDTTRKYSVRQLTKKKELQKYISQHFNECEIMPGGYEINWNDVLCIHIEKLRTMGEQINISFKYFEKFAQQNIVNTAEACEMLDCSRQNIEDSVRREKLKPIQESAKNKMFLRADINEKRW